MKARATLMLYPMVGLASAALALANCVGDDENATPAVTVDAAFDAATGTDATSNADGSRDVTATPDTQGAPDVVADVATDAPDLDAGADVAADAAEAGPLFDDAGCPIPTGVSVSLQDAGIPVTGLVLWLRADIGVATLNGADGGTVCRWDDVSGSNHAFIPGSVTPPSKSETALNGLPAVVISGPNQHLYRPDVLGIPATNGRTIAAYGKATDTTHRFEYLVQGQAGSPGLYFGLDQNTFQTAGSREGVEITDNAYDTNIATNGLGRSHVFSISSFVAGTAMPGALTYSIDGTLATFTRKGGAGNGTVESFAAADVTAVGPVVGATFTGASIGEILVYDRALTAPERAQVEQHFSDRF